MRPLFSRAVPALVLALAAGAGAHAARPVPRLDPAALAQIRALQPQRVTQAQAHLAALRPQLGLGDRDGFVPRHAFTNTQGQTIVRLEQTYEGHRVWGGQAVAHVLPDGGIRTLTRSVRPGIALAGEPRLRPEQAQALAVARLGSRGAVETPRVSQVVFPAQFLGGLAAIPDPATGRPGLDRRQVVHARLEAPYVWAFEVVTRVHNAVDGAHEQVTLVHGDTGAILRTQDLVQHLDPVTGTGKGYYRGDVALNSTRMADGSYTLMDTTRGTLPNPGLQFFSADAASGWDPSLPALQVWFAQNDATGAYTWSDYLFQGNTNAWGDGLPFTQWGSEGQINGQTAGVDAMSAMTTTWDFYKNVFGRDGMDAQGTAPVATVLRTGAWYVDNASWSIWGHGMDLGAGTYPANPKGFRSMTDLDVVAHEMTHGVTSPSFSQYWTNGSGFEEAGLNEATSDFFAQMVKAYTTCTPGADATIPATGADWRIGQNVGHGTPIRWMDQPSRDQRSPDGWYDGIAYMDGHYSAGPLNRAFHFLCNGASASAGSPSHSAYLPAGMTGIGNDAAARILYKAVTERLVGDGTGAITFQEVREAALAAAEELYGAPSLEAAAVENAFGAANIGLGHGQGTRTQVLFQGWRNGDYIDFTHTYGNEHKYSNRQVLPKGETVRPRIAVLNNPDTRVTWRLGGPSMFNGADDNVQKGGVLNADGSWTTPNVMGWHAITATSVADPTQQAEGRVFLINMDTDMDLEQDALDMAGIAFSWWLTNSLNPAHSVFEAPWVDDADAAFFVDAMKSTWSAQ